MPYKVMPYKGKGQHLDALKPAAILIDGGFFLKRYRKCYKGGAQHNPKTVASNMYTMAMSHVDGSRLYRIFYYDCPPLDKKAHNPITQKSIDFGRSDFAKFRNQFHDELKRLRKVALRQGYLRDNGGWVIRPEKTKELLKGNISMDDLSEHDVTFGIRQKGVDIKIGLDIASLAFKQQVDRIILISGDADFVPAAKLARIEGIDFILDPMWKRVDENLYEHIDGLKSFCPKPIFL